MFHNLNSKRLLCYEVYLYDGCQKVIFATNFGSLINIFKWAKHRQLKLNVDYFIRKRYIK